MTPVYIVQALPLPPRIHRVSVPDYVLGLGLARVWEWLDLYRNHQSVDLSGLGNRWNSERAFNATWHVGVFLNEVEAQRAAALCALMGDESYD